MTENSGLGGVFAPVLTPFRSDLEPDPGRFASHCRWLLDDGCHGLVLFGTTSEANSLAVDERIALTEAAVEAGIAPAKLVVGTGMCAIPDSVRLTAHAVGMGCAGVLMLPPFYYKGMSDDGLFAAFSEVIERVGDSRLRLYLYHIPPVSKVGISLGLVDRLLKSYEGQVAGIKDSSGDWENTRSLLHSFPGFGTFTGTEAALLATMRGGGRGCISATANVNARAIRRLYDAWESAEADALQGQVTAVRSATQSKPAIPALKRILARHLNDDGWLNLRPPFTALDDTQAGELFTALAGAGFALKLD